MTGSNIGIRGVLPFAGTPERRRKFENRSERSLAKHARASVSDAPLAAYAQGQEQGQGQGQEQEPLSLDPGHVLDIKV